MDVDAAVAVSIGLYQMYDHAITGEVKSISKKYIYLSILASILWLSYQYRKGANFSAVYTGLGLLLNLYLLHLKGNGDKKEQ
jgi:lipid-A-disaccharide synthase-like uncharacterized protein